MKQGLHKNCRVPHGIAYIDYANCFCIPIIPSIKKDCRFYKEQTIARASFLFHSWKAPDIINSVR